jgi:prophage regulatory protein
MKSVSKIDIATEAARAMADRQLLTMKQVTTLTTYSRPSVYRLLAEGSFPAPLKLGRNRVAFLAIEIEEWLAARPRAVTRRGS